MTDHYGSMPEPPPPPPGYGYGPQGQAPPPGYDYGPQGQALDPRHGYQGMPPAYGSPPGYGYPVPPRPPRPPVVENAVRLMFLRSVISLVSIIVSFATIGQLKHRIERANPGFTGSHIDSVLDVAIGVGAVLGVVILVLYVLLAFQVRAGKNWARIVTWVFAAIGVLGALSSLAGTATPESRIISLILGVIDLVIIVMLAQGASNRYFKPGPY